MEAPTALSMTPWALLQIPLLMGKMVELWHYFGRDLHSFWISFGCLGLVHVGKTLIALSRDIFWASPSRSFKRTPRAFHSLLLEAIWISNEVLWWFLWEHCHFYFIAHNFCLKRHLLKPFGEVLLLLLVITLVKFGCYLILYEEVINILCRNGGYFVIATTFQP